MSVLPWEGYPLASLLLCDLNVMEGLLTMALGNKMLIPPKQTLGFIGMGYHQNALLQNTSQGPVIPFYGMKCVTFYLLRQSGDWQR